VNGIGSIKAMEARLNTEGGSGGAVFCQRIGSDDGKPGYGINGSMAGDEDTEAVSMSHDKANLKKDKKQLASVASEKEIKRRLETG
jgi:hypothetical protein